MADELPTMAELRARIRALSGDSRRAVNEYVVWANYLSLGGRASWFEFQAYLYEALVATEMTVIRIDQVVWELEEFGP